FFVNNKPNNTPVSVSDLEIEHTKLMHVIGVRSDMNEFFHIHPVSVGITGTLMDAKGELTHLPISEVEPGVLTVAHMFQKPGNYKLWSQIQKDGVVHTFGHPAISVQGDGEKEAKDVSFGRNVIVGNYQVVLDLQEPVSQKHEHELKFDIHTLTGREAELDDYLGAKMHLAVIKDDLKQFIHTHPEGHDHAAIAPFIPKVYAHSADEEPSMSMTEDEHALNFQVTFPEAGLYKAFAQFRPAGIDLPPDEALLAEFWIKVVEEAPPAIPPRITYLFASLILMALLSWGTYRFINVKKV
ncbi:hypothetical protein HY967_04225, partial [Candidatus Jorgensenbacteria bacterium]|nr:hypothetical protein [Candidatus Jorgensenbacteria bacterium]